MLDEPIVIVSYDAGWPLAAAREMERVGGALGPLVVECDHIGSTSVPECDAKPIIDLLVGLRTWPPTVEVHRPVAMLGYENLGEAGVPGRAYCRLRQGQPYNLALTEHAGALWLDNLAIRDLLRKDAVTRARYVEAKRAAFREGKAMLLGYSAHKAAFMDALLARANEGSRS